MADFSETDEQFLKRIKRMASTMGGFAAEATRWEDLKGVDCNIRLPLWAVMRLVGLAGGFMKTVEMPAAPQIPPMGPTDPQEVIPPPPLVEQAPPRSFKDYTEALRGEREPAPPAPPDWGE